MRLAAIDRLIVACYFGAVLYIGFALRRRIRGTDDFLLSGRSIPLWMTGIAFMAANLGSLEIMGMVANGAKYGMLTNHFYWVGAIPAMVFLGVCMMPFYYQNKVRSVPEYLKRRFDSRTHVLNALTFAVMTILMSGINMFALAVVLRTALGWSFHFSLLISGGVVVVYTYLGGLSSSIYNEVLQFFLIVAGFLPLSIMGLKAAGGWGGLQARLPDTLLHTWKYMGSTNFISPLFATFLLGMFWKRANKTGAFYGMIAGIGGSVGHYLAYRAGLLYYPSAMAPNFYGAICGWTASMVVTVALSLATPPPAEETLAGLVFSRGGVSASAGMRWYARPVFQGACILAGAAALNVIFW